MIAIVRLIMIGIFILLSHVVVLHVCLLQPRNIMNVHFAAKFNSKVSWLLGVKFTITGRENILSGSCVYVAKHQSNYDIFFPDWSRTAWRGVHRKKSILYLPFFELIYWLSDNIFIERGNNKKPQYKFKYQTKI